MIIMSITRYLRGVVALFETYYEISEGACGIV